MNRRNWEAIKVIVQTCCIFPSTVSNKGFSILSKCSQTSDWNFSAFSTFFLFPFAFGSTGGRAVELTGLDWLVSAARIIAFGVPPQSHACISWRHAFQRTKRLGEWVETDRERIEWLREEIGTEAWGFNAWLTDWAIEEEIWEEIWGLGFWVRVRLNEGKQQNVKIWRTKG